MFPRRDTHLNLYPVYLHQSTYNQSILIYIQSIYIQSSKEPLPHSRPLRWNLQNFKILEVSSLLCGFFEIFFSRERKFQNFGISKFRNFKISEFQNFRISDFQNFKISEFQNFRVSKFQNFKISEFQNFRISKFQNFGFSKFQIFTWTKFFFEKLHIEGRVRTYQN